MKTVTLILICSIFLFGCSGSGIKDVAAFEFGNNWYWVLSYKNGTPEVDLKKYAENHSKGTKYTKYFFFYSDNKDASILKNERFSLEKFAFFIKENKPDYSLYVMPNDKTVYDDGYDVISMAVSN